MKPNVRSVYSKQALAVYAESLAAGGRVAVFGDASLGIASRLVTLGAQAVQVWDPDRVRVRVEAERAPPGVTVQVYSAAETLLARPVDLVIVPDLGLFEDPAALIARVRDTAGDEGLALVAAASADAAADEGARTFDYYELFDLVAGGFEDVRMVAQVPFYGLALVRLGDEDEPQSVSVDSQLADEERAPEAFVVLASRKPIAFDPYSIIELPPPPPAALPYELEARSASLAEAVERAQRQLQEAGRQVEALQNEIRVRAAAAERTSERILDLETSLVSQSTRCAELEAALVERARHLSDLSTEVEEMRAAADAGRIAAADMEQIARRADRAERRVAETDQLIAGLADAHATEVARFEEGLRERAHFAQGLESELLRRDKMVRDLISALEEASSAPLVAALVEPRAELPAPTPPAPVDRTEERALADENARLRAQLNGLALEIARREGEAQATTWTVAELERRLAQSAAHRDHLEADGTELRAAQSELDALRRALAQEHEARGKAESGEKVARALLDEMAPRQDGSSVDTTAERPA